jgi:UDP-hydrolysing UDP-N-acetyl-D-glucosamine 2-epimerase
MKVTTVIVDRANYGRLKPILMELQKNDNEIESNVICCGTTLLKRFHQPVNEISQLFHVSHRIYHEVEGDTEQSMVHSMAMLMPQLALALQQNRPDFVIVIGDRFEALAVATVVAMMKLCLVHIQGGEVSGNIDNSIRNAITKLAHYHLPATAEAACNLAYMGENAQQSIMGIGCPSVDLVSDVKIDKTLEDTVLCVYHPEDCVNNNAIVNYMLGELATYGKQVLMLWPNIDTGSEGIVKTIRRYIANHNPDWLNMLVNVTPGRYMEMLASVKGCVGNSSSFVRDASFFGTPVIIIGNRQQGRIKTNNVTWLSNNELDALHLKMCSHFATRFHASICYGREGVSRRFVETLKTLKVKHLKVACHV